MPIYCVSGQIQIILCLVIVSVIKYRLSYAYLLCQWSNTDYLMPIYCVSGQIQIILCLVIVSVVKYRLYYAYLLCQWSNTDYLMPIYCVSGQIQTILCLFIVSVVKYRYVKCKMYSMIIWYHRFYDIVYSCVISTNFCRHLFNLTPI
jgi:hypothetical protein